jgi:hypothetical protein
MTTVTVDSDVEAPLIKRTEDQNYQEFNNAVSSDASLFSSQPIAPRRHQFDAAEAASLSYFPEEGVLKELFLKENSMLRFRLFVIW